MLRFMIRGKQSAAIVLAGAVAKGAFEAGVVAELVDREISFDRFVGTSAGALSATLLAAGAASGRLGHAARKLEALWRDRAGLLSFLRPQLSFFEGLSTTRGVERLVLSSLREIVQSGPRSTASLPTKLTLVTTDLRGSLYRGELTHEDEYVFDQDQLLDPTQWETIAAIAAASAAFPLLFIPPTLTGGGRRVDGGIVNNAPLSYAIDKTSDRNAIVVVSAEPKAPPRASALRGPGLVVRLIEILINERLGRDVVVARDRNETRRELILALKGAAIDAEALADRLGFRDLDILEVHPRKPLAGGAFGGFFLPSKRREQIRKGRYAAIRALADRARPFPLPSRSNSDRTLADGVHNPHDPRPSRTSDAHGSA